MQKRVFKRILSLVLSVLLVGALFLPTTGIALAVTGNLLANGDFEAANSLASFLTGTQTRAVISGDKSYAGSGKSLLMTPYESTTTDSSTTNYVKQQIAVEANSTYVWTFYVNCSWGTSWDDILRFGVHGNSDFSDNLITDRETSGITTVYSTANSNYYINRTTPAMNQNQWYRMTAVFNSGSRTTVYLGCSVYRTAKVDPNFKAYTDNWTLTKYENDLSNPVLNGGFENGTYKYVFSYPGGNFSNTGTYPTSAVTHTGSYALQSTSVADNSGAKFYQGINVTENTNYQWSFWLKFDGTITSDAIRVGVYKTELTGSLLPTAIDFISTGISCSNLSTAPPIETGRYNYLISNSINQAWAKYTITFNSGSNTKVYLTFINTVAVTKIYTDDWSVSSSTSPVGQIVNGSFENESSLDDYLVSNYTRAQKSSVKARGGNSSLLLTPYPSTTASTTPSNYVKQKVAVEANKTYQWTFYVNCRWNTSYEDLLRFGVHSTAAFSDSLVDKVDSPELTTTYNSDSFSYYINKSSMTQNRWYQIDVVFHTGSATSVYLGCSVFRTTLVDAAFQAYTDEWKLEKVSVPAYDNGELISTSFENVKETVGSVRSDAQGYWTKTSEITAHTGTYSAKYDASNTKLGWVENTWTDIYGNDARYVSVEPNTQYKFTYWYKAGGDYTKVKIAHYHSGLAQAAWNYIVPTTNNWTKVEWTFTTDASTTTLKMGLCGCFYNTTAAWVYIDDISLVKTGVITTDERTISIDNTSPVNTDFTGTAGVYHSYLYMPDSTLSTPYTTEELQLEADRLLQMGVKMVRTKYYPSWSWNEADNTWDWNSTRMQAFYRYADVMKQNGIEICISYWNVEGDTTGTVDDEGRENPFPVLAGSTAFADCVKRAGQWAVDFTNQVIINRGYSNIKYLAAATEPDLYGCYGESASSFENFGYWLTLVKTFHEYLTAAGIRGKISIVGPQSVYQGTPNTAINTSDTSFTWLKWAIQYANNYIDIYSSHRYVFSSYIRDDYYAEWHDFIKECVKIVQPTGKKFWADEFNMLEYGNYRHSSADPVHATQVALAQIGQMNAGVDSALVWQLMDQKWPEKTLTAAPSWESGVHVIGLNPNFRETLVPRNAYYVYSLLSKAIGSGGKIYAGVCVKNGVYATMVERADGEISIIVVSTVFNKVDIKAQFSSSIGGRTLYRYEYSPFEFEATSQALPIASDSAFKNVTDTITDVIPAYAVTVYTTVNDGSLTTAPVQLRVNANNTLTGLYPGMTVSELTDKYTKSMLAGQSGTQATVVDTNGDAVNLTSTVCTGQKMRIYSNGSVYQHDIVLYGDVDGNGKIELNDLTLVKEHLLEQRTIAVPYLFAADLYGEGDITLNDLTGLISAVSEETEIGQDRQDSEVANQVINGGFEIGKYQYTFGYPAGDFAKTYTVTTTNEVHSGNYSLQSTCNSPDNWGNKFYQGVRVKANTNYEWSFWLKFNGTVKTDALRIGVYSTELAENIASTSASFIGNDITSSNPVAVPEIELGTTTAKGYKLYNKAVGEWVKYTVSFSTGSNTKVFLTMINNLGSAKIYTDDWSLEVAGAAGIGKIVNGNFENLNSLDSFLTTSSTRAAISSDKAYRGTGSLLLTPYADATNGNNTLNYVKRQVPVETNTTYEWDFYVNCSWGSSWEDILRFGVHSTSGLTDSLITKVSSPNLTTTQSPTYPNYYLNKTGMTQNQWYKITVTFNSGSCTSVYLGCSVLRTTMVDPDFKAYTDDWTLTKLVVPSLRLTEQMISRSVVEEGNLERLAGVMKKAQRGEPVTIGVIGGSITEGSKATTAAKTYAGLVKSWWQTAFPQSTVTFVNAGIGSTGSLIGVHRVADDLLSKNPDFVIVEYAVNDSSDSLSKETYDNLVRRILSSSSNPAVMLLFMMRDTGASEQSSQVLIGEHYDLPMISYKDALWPELNMKRFLWSDIGADIVHPNDTGHAIAGQLVNNFLQNTLNKLDTLTTGVTEVVAPLISNSFENAKLLTNKTLTPVSLGGFTKVSNAYYAFPNGWTVTNSTVPIVFQVTGKNLFLLYKMDVSGNGGKATIKVDGTAIGTVDSNFSGGWGDNPVTYQLLRTVSSATHTIEIQLQSDPEKNKFTILGLLQS